MKIQNSVSLFRQNFGQSKNQLQNQKSEVNFKGNLLADTTKWMHINHCYPEYAKGFTNIKDILHDVDTKKALQLLRGSLNKVWLVSCEHKGKLEKQVQKVADAEYHYDSLANFDEWLKKLEEEKEKLDLMVDKYYADAVAKQPETDNEIQKLYDNRLEMINGFNALHR